MLVGGCDLPPVRVWVPTPDPPASGSAAQNSAFEERPVRLVRGPEPEYGASPRQVRLDVVLTVLHVQVPRAGRDQLEPLWNHLREDVLDNRTALRLRGNGLRIGIGNACWWEAIKATVDAVEGVRSAALDPVRVPPDYPLALELDERPREQTLFFLGEDGILSGQTWPHSRNVLRVNYQLDPRNPLRVWLTVVPEVRQRLDGWRWVRSESGLAQLPQYSGQAFAAASFRVGLEPGEFLLVAPGPQADLYGIVGGAFLASDQDGQRYDSYVFLRADVNHVAYRR
jgi:hypothetical protein